MEGIVKYIEKLKEIYGNEIIVRKSNYSNEILATIPKPLREFYSIYESIDTPFGYIYSIESSIEESKNEPYISGGWFSFGFDGYFSYWLCSYDADEDGCYLVSWDHEVDDVIEATDNNIIEFLEYIREEYEENKN